MTRIFVASTALALVLAAPLAKAQSADGAMGGFTYAPTGDEIRASDFIGSRVYTSDTDVTDQTAWDAWDGDRTSFDDIGEINDVLMGEDGQVDAILVDVGGFLGIAEKSVAVSMDKLRLVSDGDGIEDFFVVFTSTREDIENAPQFQEEERAGLEGTTATTTAGQAGRDTAVVPEGSDATARDGAAYDMTQAGEPGGMGTGTGSGEMAPEAGGTAGFTAPQIEREGYTTASVDEMTAEQLEGARVYDAEDKWIGEVSQLELDGDGKVSDAVVNVGGFLGLGEKSVLLSFQEMNIQKLTEGDEVRVYLDATKDQLMALPEYEG